MNFTQLPFNAQCILGTEVYLDHAIDTILNSILVMGAGSGPLELGKCIEDENLLVVHKMI